jgi:hypothetical protein
MNTMVALNTAWMPFLGDRAGGARLTRISATVLDFSGAGGWRTLSPGVRRTPLRVPHSSFSEGWDFDLTLRAKAAPPGRFFLFDFVTRPADK